MPLFLGWRCSRALLKLNTTTTATTAATATATATSLLNLIRHNSSFPSSQHHHHEPAMSLMRFRSIPPKRGILFHIARLNLTPSTLYLHMPQTHCMSPSTASQINHASNSTIFTWLGTFWNCAANPSNYLGNLNALYCWFAAIKIWMLTMWCRTKYFN